jgi:hypothetical protein
LRLNFTLPSPAEIDEGTRRLGRALHSLSRQVQRESDRSGRQRSVTPIV